MFSHITCYRINFWWIKIFKITFKVKGQGHIYVIKSQPLLVGNMWHIIVTPYRFFTVVYLVNARAHGQKITHTDISLPKQYSVSPFRRRARPRYTLNKPETKTQFKTSFICQQLFQQWRSQGEWEFEPPSPSGICLNLLLGRLRHGQF